jgi:DNA-binding MarR family transcriptional regulator
VRQAAQRDLKILTEIAARDDITQRGLSESLGIALGLTNLYIKRLTRKGYVKITTIPTNRLKYLLTPRGIARKTRLTYEYMSFSLVLYRETRQRLRVALQPIASDGSKRVALCGTGEAAELTYLTLKEVGLDTVAVFADTQASTFLDLPVRPLRELVNADVDRVVVVTFSAGDRLVDQVTRLGLPREKLILLGGQLARGA